VSCPQTTDNGFSLSLFDSLSLTLTRSLVLSLSRSLSCRVHKPPTMDFLLFALSLSRFPTLSLSMTLCLSLSLALSFSRSLALCRVVSTNHRQWIFSCSLSRSLALLLSRSLALSLFGSRSSCLHNQDSTGGSCRLVLASERAMGPKRPVAK